MPSVHRRHAPIVIAPLLPNLGDWWQIVRPEDPAAEEPDYDFSDIHSHNFCSTFTDWEGDRSDTDARIDRLKTMADATSIGQMVISGMVDPTSGSDPVDDTSTVNSISLYAADRYPDLLLPFLQVFQQDFDDEWTPTYVETALASGDYVGVGELFVHGHQSNYDEVDSLVAICRRAALYGVPVQVHWEYGNVDATVIDKTTGTAIANPRTAAENFDQLTEVLNHFMNVPIADWHYTTQPNVSDWLPLKLICAHCGIGPGNTMDATLLADWEARIELLLAAYPNVYFDLAGMQVGGVSQLLSGASPTAAGQFLLEKMAAYPDRFLVGIDTENRADETFTGSDGTHSGTVDTYTPSVSNYGTYLTKGTLTADQQKKVRRDNLPVVLFTKGTEITVSTSSTVFAP